MVCKVCRFMVRWNLRARLLIRRITARHFKRCNHCRRFEEHYLATENLLRRSASQKKDSTRPASHCDEIMEAVASEKSKENDERSVDAGLIEGSLGLKGSVAAVLCVLLISGMIFFIVGQNGTRGTAGDHPPTAAMEKLQTYYLAGAVSRFGDPFRYANFAEKQLSAEGRYLAKDFRQLYEHFTTVRGVKMFLLPGPLSSNRDSDSSSRLTEG